MMVAVSKERAREDRRADDRLITRPFVFVTLAALAFFVYVGTMVPILPRYVERELGGGEAAIGLTLASFSIAAIAARPMIGAIGERRGRRILMLGGSLLAFICGSLLAFASSLPVVLALRAGAGVGEAALFVGAATLIADLSPARRRAEAASYFSVAVFGGIGLGPVIGELVLGDDRYALAFVVGSAFALAAAGLSLLAPSRVRGVAVATAGQVRRFHPAALAPGAVLALGVGAFATFNAFVPTHTDDLGLSGASGVFLTYSVICLVVRIFGARLPDRLGLGLAAGSALLMQAAGLAVIGLVPNPIGLYAGTAVIGLGMSLMYPALMAATVNSVPETERASVVSSFTMFFEVGVAGGGLLLGSLAEASGGGPRTAFLAGALVSVAGFVVLRRVLLPRVAPVVPVASARPTASLTAAAVCGD
jgi:MFS family permease